MIYTSFESSQEALQLEHGQFENLEIVQFRKIKFYFANLLGIGGEFNNILTTYFKNHDK